MRRREFIGFVGGIAASPLTARAQQSEMPVIGRVSEAPAISAHLLAAFKRGMAELGYVEGKNFATEDRYKPESLPQAVADLVRRTVERSRCEGICSKHARPGGNITGMFLDIPELSGKQLGLLKEIVPRLSRIAVFGTPNRVVDDLSGAIDCSVLS